MLLLTFKLEKHENGADVRNITASENLIKFYTGDVKITVLCFEKCFAYLL